MYDDYPHFTGKRVETWGRAGDFLNVTKPVRITAGVQTQSSVTNIPDY